MTTPDSAYPKSDQFGYYILTGTVLETTRWSETHVSGGGGGGYMYNGHGSSYVNPVTSTTVRHSEIWIRDDEGNEEQLRFSTVEVPVRAGQRLSAICARPIRKTKRNYDIISYYNVTTNRGVHDDIALKQVIRSTIPLYKRGLVLWFALWMLMAPFAERMESEKGQGAAYSFILSAAIVACFCYYRSAMRRKHLLAGIQHAMDELHTQANEPITITGRNAKGETKTIELAPA